jgi:hypothetical protein
MCCLVRFSVYTPPNNSWYAPDVQRDCRQNSRYHANDLTTFRDQRIWTHELVKTQSHAYKQQDSE